MAVQAVGSPLWELHRGCEGCAGCARWVRSVRLGRCGEARWRFVPRASFASRFSACWRGRARQPEQVGRRRQCQSRSCRLASYRGCHVGLPHGASRSVQCLIRRTQERSGARSSSGGTACIGWLSHRRSRSEHVKPRWPRSRAYRFRPASRSGLLPISADFTWTSLSGGMAALGTWTLVCAAPACRGSPARLRARARPSADGYSPVGTGIGGRRSGRPGARRSPASPVRRRRCASQLVLSGTKRWPRRPSEPGGISNGRRTRRLRTLGRAPTPSTGCLGFRAGRRTIASPWDRPTARATPTFARTIRHRAVLRSDGKADGGPSREVGTWARMPVGQSRARHRPRAWRLSAPRDSGGTVRPGRGWRASAALLSTQFRARRQQSARSSARRRSRTTRI